MEDPSRRKMILEKMEKNLSIALARNENDTKISKAVQKVREAKLSYFKGQKEISRYKEENENKKLTENIQQHLKNIEKNLKLWESIPENEIINLYSDENA